MEAVANVLSLDFDFFKAISNDSETLNEYKSDLAPSHKACYVSHYKVWELIALQKYESALILEDDVDIEMSISSIVSKVHRDLPGNWEMVYLGHCSDEGDYFFKFRRMLNPSLYKLFKSNSPSCTHAYAISSLGVSKLLKELVDPKDPIDVELVYRIKAGNITSYSLEPSAIVQWKSFDNPSDISPGAMDAPQLLESSTMHFLGLT
ncbi:1280_t:CDS:1 [Funneliformis caledonium]|uniref:1280_t:CDS:1 n=1 Tax=Funneliformis caledonium TaxID=1117310 RepID=A0A9N9DB84_9GLOM|nr:1280_t:CDS:1 [Funneliformis caledonium]